MAVIRKVRKRRARTKEDTMNLKHRHPHRRHIQGPIGTALIALTLLPTTIDVTPCAKLVPSTAVLSVILQQRMSAHGTKQTCSMRWRMSAFGGNADSDQ